MSTFRDFLRESKEIKTIEELEDFIHWVNTLDLSKKTPRGMKEEKLDLVNLKKIIDVYNTFKGEPNYEPDFNVYNYYIEKFDRDKINDKFGAVIEKPNTVVTKYAKYIKSDVRAYSKFTDSVANIDSFLGTLNGYHKKHIKDLTIRFVSSKDLKSIAKYKGDNDEILVNISRSGDTKEEYGSLRYIILHELGHRYLTKYRQGFDINALEWITTKYSQKDSFSGEEKFAELFAISHWKSKYTEYKDTIKRWENMIK